MRLISLNTWGGKIYGPLVGFVKREADATDVFCFQELYFSKIPRPEAPWIKSDLAIELRNELSDFLMFERLSIKDTRPQNKMSGKDVKIGEAIFVRKSTNIIERGGFRTYAEDCESVAEKIEPATGVFQFVKVEDNNQDYFIGNIHGIWLPGSKSDTPKRLEQSSRLKDFIKKQPGKKVLCGDFNLQPNTESIKLLDSEMRDLIKEYGIKTTRSRYYADMQKYADYIADYVFVSSDVEVINFKVLPDEVSDHLPLLLEFK